MRSPDTIPLVSVPELERLARALQAMPQVAPGQSSWESISMRMQAPVRTPAHPRALHGRWFALAAAASVAVASAWLGFAQGDRDAIQKPDRVAVAGIESPPERAAASTPTAQEALVARSGSLERWLVESGSAQWPQDFGSASASVEIENLIAHVDQRLTRSSSNTERDQLWQRRVALLEQLVTLQGEPMALSIPASDRSFLL